MLNFYADLQKIISETPAGSSLLLHSCCAPCSSHVIYALSEHFSITVFYYNPNITEREEYFHRVLEQKRLISEMPTAFPVSFIEGDYEPEAFFSAVKGHECDREGGARCRICYRQRILKTAIVAKEKGFDFFTTTLSISPLKSPAVINEVGYAVQDEVGVRWLPSDFKKKDGYKHSIELSKQYSLYRQNYCGCIYSKNQERNKPMIKSNAELPIGLQMFSLREMMEDDMEAGFKAAAEAGYKFVELTTPSPADKIKELLDKYGLKAVAVHAELPQVQKRFDEFVESAKTIGYDTIVLPWNELRRAKEAIAYAEEANVICDKLRKEGLKMAYHNHDHEFYREHKTGELILDVLFNHFDKDITWEIDIYWVRFANCDPIDFINRMKGRIRLAHIKEISKGEPKTNPEIGLGEFDMPKIVTALREIGGAEILIVEQEQHTMPEAESVAYSYKSLADAIKK